MSTSASYATVVQELYVAYFGRPADPTGLQNFEAALAAANAPTTLAGLSADYATNPAIAALVNAFGDSGESGRLYGTAISASAGAAQQFVTAVFEDLFNRAPLQGGLDFWSNALLTGSMTPGEAAMEIALGAGTADAATFANKIAAASAFTADLITGNLTPGYSGPVAAADGRAFLAGITSSTTAVTYQAGATTAIDNMLGISPTPTPTPTPTPSPGTMALTVSGDTIHLSNTTVASTVTLTGADLTAYPSGTYGTVAELVTAAITTVTDSGGNFTLNASGNSDPTTFNFGTGVVSGSDPASSAGITYMGVTTYVTSTLGDTVTLSAAAQNVTGGATGSNTINLAALTYTGTLAFGAAGADTINATVGHDISGGTITSGGATVALVISAAGTETLSTAEFNLITTGADSGGLSFTSGTFGTDHITFSNAGTVTAIANVGNYNIAVGDDIVTLNNVADNVTDNGSTGDNVIHLGALAYTGTIGFGSGGSDTVDVTVGGNISGGTITTSAAEVALALSGAGTETLNTAEYNLFSVGGITGGTFGGNTITFSNAGSVTATSSVGNYDLSTAGNTIMLNNVADDVNGAASGTDTVNLAALVYTGTVDFGASGSDTIEVAGTSNISGGTINTGGATVALLFNVAGNETMTTVQYNLFDATGISGGSFGGNTITFSDAGTVTANANVGKYDLSTAGNTITLNSAADNVTGAASGSDTVSIAAVGYTGTIAFGASGADAIDITVGGNLGAGSVTSGGATVALVFSGAGAESMNTAEYNLFNATSITGGSFGGDSITFTNAGTVTADANIGNYVLSTAGDTITLTNVADDVTGAASGSDTVNLAALTYTGTVAFGASGSDVIDVTIAGDISGGTITTGGATVALVLSGAGTETMTTAQYTLFNTTSITGGTFGGDTIAFSDAGTVTANANVGNYDLATAGNTITLNNVADDVTGAPSGNDTVNLGTLTYTGALAFGAAGADTINATVGHDIGGGTIASGGATVALVLSAAGTETLSTEEFNLITTGADSGGLTFTGGAFGTDHITFSDSGTVTAISNVGTYDLYTGGDTSIGLDNVADNVTDSGISGGDEFVLSALTYTGTITVGSAGATDFVEADAGGDISGATFTSSGVGVDLEIIGSGTETISAAEVGLFSATGIVFTAGSDNTLIVNPATNSPVTIVDSDLANFANVQNVQIGSSGSGTQSITLGGNFSALIDSLTTSSSSGTITIDASVTTNAATLTASSTAAGGNISITTGIGGDTVNATIVAGSTLSVNSNGADTITLNSGAGTASVIAGGVDTIDLGAGHTSGNDTVTLSQAAIGTQITNWLSNDTLDLSIANFTGANAIYGNSGVSGTIAAQAAHTESVVTFVAGQTSNVGDDLYDMGATTFANAAALATYLDNAVNALTFSSGTVPAAGASLLFEYEDPSGNAHLALVQLANGATDTTAATVVDVAEFVGVAATSSLHNIHLT